jgi:hypothetical protein
MTRRWLFLLPLAVCLRADAEKDARELIASAAGALSTGSAESFLDAFDKGMPDLEKLRYNVVGLLSQAEVSCSIEIKSNEGDDSERTLALDWILTIESRDGAPGTTRRQKTVKCRLKKTGKKWRIVWFEPLDLFASPGA